MLLMSYKSDKTDNLSLKFEQEVFKQSFLLLQ